MTMCAFVPVKYMRCGDGTMKVFLEPVFVVAIFQSRLLFSQHLVNDCVVLADFVVCLLFHCVC